MIKRVLAVMATIILVASACCLTGCSKYASHYNALGLVHSKISNSAFMSFYRFEGTMVFKLECPSESAGKIAYSAKLEDGSATVYYDSGGTKTELFSLDAGQTIDSSGGQLEKGAVYVLVETNGSCLNGEFHFDIE